MGPGNMQRSLSLDLKLRLRTKILQRHEVLCDLQLHIKDPHHLQRINWETNLFATVNAWVCGRWTLATSYFKTRNSEQNTASDIIVMIRETPPKNWDI